MRARSTEQSRSHDDHQEAFAREVEKIVARELEPLRRELAILREYVDAFGVLFEPW